MNMHIKSSRGAILDIKAKYLLSNSLNNMDIYKNINYFFSKCFDRMRLNFSQSCSSLLTAFNARQKKATFLNYPPKALVLNYDY
jgi:hypothetical protein